jgi:ABC-2 type transport system permease protein
MKRIIAQARKELTQTFRDRLTVALALVLPLVLIALFGTTISLSVKGLSVVVQDLDQSAMSRKYVDAVNSSLTFVVTGSAYDRQPEDALKSEEARAAIIIPEHFERDILRGKGAEVQWLVDATDANTANIMRGGAMSITQAFAGQDAKQAVRAEMRLWYNPGGDSQKYIGPAVFAVVLALFPPLLAALATSREGEQKTILQVYVSSISAAEYLSGKILAFFIIALAEWALALVLAMWMFDLRFAGDPTPLIVGTVLYLLCNINIGVLIGGAIPNQATAIQMVAVFSFLLSFLLSGFVFPLANVPAEIRWISSIVPASYFIEITRDAFVRGGGWSAVWQAPVSLAGLATLFFLLAWRNMRHMQVQS